MNVSELWNGPLTPVSAIAGIWVAWALSWVAASRWARRTTAHAPQLQALPGRILTGIGIVLAFMPFVQFGPFWRVNDGVGWAMLALVVAGICFAWWARLHLGSLWSGTVTRKENHRVVDTGPYSIVRHPIYTGIILSIFATAIARGRLDALIGAAVFAVGIALIARLEERFLSEELGAEYAAYKQRVRMLVPFVL